MEQQTITISARFDLDQTGNRLDWNIFDANGQSLYEKDGQYAGTVVLPRDSLVKLQLIGHRAAVPSHDDKPPEFWLDGVALITVPREDTAYASPFMTKGGAVLSIGREDFEVIDVPAHGSLQYGFQLKRELRVDQWRGLWELSLLATVRRSDDPLARHTVLRFDPEVQVGAGNNPPT